MAKVTLDDIYNVVINVQDNMVKMQGNMNTMQNNMNTMQNNMNTMQNNMNTMQNTLLSMKDDIHRLDKKIDDTKAELKAEIGEVKDFVTHEFQMIGTTITKTIKETMKPYTDEVENIVTFLKPQGYVSVREDSAKYNA